MWRQTPNCTVESTGKVLKLQEGQRNFGVRFEPGGSGSKFINRGTIAAKSVNDNSGFNIAAGSPNCPQCRRGSYSKSRTRFINYGTIDLPEHTATAFEFTNTAHNSVLEFLSGSVTSGNTHGGYHLVKNQSNNLKFTFGGTASLPYSGHTFSWIHHPPLPPLPGMFFCREQRFTVQIQCVLLPAFVLDWTIQMKTTKAVRCGSAISTRAI